MGLPYLGKPKLAEEMIDNELKNIFENIRTREHSLEEVSNILKATCSKPIKAIEPTLNLVLKGLGKEEISLRDRALIAVVLDEVKKSLSHGWFPEGAPNVDPKVSSLLYAADRKYSLPVINEMLEDGINIVFDRYVYSSMGHQGGKIIDPEERKRFFKWVEDLEFDELPQSDVKLFLHLPSEYVEVIKRNRKEELDEHERDLNHLCHAEKAFIEVARMFDFKTIECLKKRSQPIAFEDIKTPDEIGEEMYNVVKRKLSLR